MDRKTVMTTVIGQNILRYNTPTRIQHLAARLHLSTDRSIDVVREFFGRSAHTTALFLQLQQQTPNAHKVLVE